MSRLQFSGHETFALRAGWPKKAYDAAVFDERLFGQDAAVARLGVGKNMVRSIRHWGLATGVIEEDGYGAVAPSAFGHWLLADDDAKAPGADPYLEDAGTPWVLHWHLCRMPGPATLAHFVFGIWRGADLSAAALGALAEALDPWVLARGGTPPALGTLRRDVEALRATYLPPRAARGDLDDRLASPLADLGLVRLVDDEPHVRRGATRRVPPWVMAYAVLDLWQRHHPGRETLALGEALTAEGSPGRAFGLDPNAAFDLFDAMERDGGAPFVFRDSAGVQQLYRTPGTSARPLDALARHYARAEAVRLSGAAA